ncbi:sensor histidine kinase [Corallococcus macrosporus]|uniref:Signal transduction histidine-protein kinase/phosphatase MprB n=1 Tax=Myxococcus fulvus (strain ATCC BAA-855 / HW-1) TaxID=483219 RepID=F8CRY0_MYXFH|nr:HAMP domain-containing sensor histidine kinase [Corallococcus macrosporus]AEI68058.1 sensor protein [Corallococcus macrosporus]
MRLAHRLLISHALLTAALLGAAAFSVVAIVRMTSLLTEVREEQLGGVIKEEAVHQAAWAVEVATRHGLFACEHNAQGVPAAADTLRHRLANLDALLTLHGASTQPLLLRAAQGYQTYARHILAGNTCERLQNAALRNERLFLAEQLTDAWINTTLALHSAIRQREKRAHDIGSSAIAVGITLGGLAVVAAWAVARWVAQGVTRPLGQLSALAHRVGDGNFAPLPEVSGPLEIRNLWADLDRMRGRLSELDQLKDAFVASASHDLRTPLARLRTAIGLLADGTAGPLTAQQQRVVELARVACEREIRLVTALLDLTRVQAGKTVRRDEGCRLDDLIERAVEEVSELAEERGTELVVIAEGTTPPASLDAALVERSLVSLMTNAVRVSAPGQRVYVTRTLSPQGPDGRPGTWARVEVRDEGPGVPVDARPRVFEPFFTRAVGAANADGLGLGLPLAQRMMRALGGDVLLLENANPGARFALVLPLGRGVPATTTPETTARRSDR